jgi:hypothetical protein
VSIAKEALGLNKGEFQKKLGNIVDAHRAGTKVIGKPRDFILTACRLSERYSKVANEEGVEVRLKNMKIGPRKVKCIHLKRKSDGFEQPVPRGQLVDSLYPPRKTVRHASPEKKHALAVRAAMRTAVDYQLRKFRKAVRLPAECVHTEKQIRIGMRWDVDHIGKPFLQLCDEWVELQGLKYLDLTLKGPPNLKKFKDDKLQKHWILWHETHATLAPSLPKANRSQGAGDYQASEALLGSLKKEDPGDVDLDF